MFQVLILWPQTFRPFQSPLHAQFKLTNTLPPKRMSGLEYYRTCEYLARLPACQVPSYQGWIWDLPDTRQAYMQACQTFLCRSCNWDFRRLLWRLLQALQCWDMYECRIDSWLSGCWCWSWCVWPTGCGHTDMMFDFCLWLVFSIYLLRIVDVDWHYLVLWWQWLWAGQKSQLQQSVTEPQSRHCSALEEVYFWPTLHQKLVIPRIYCCGCSFPFEAGCLVSVADAGTNVLAAIRPATLMRSLPWPCLSCQWMYVKFSGVKKNKLPQLIVSFIFYICKTFHIDWTHMHDIDEPTRWPETPQQHANLSAHNEDWILGSMTYTKKICWKFHAWCTLHNSNTTQ